VGLTLRVVEKLSLQGEYSCAFGHLLRLRLLSLSFHEGATKLGRNFAESYPDFNEKCLKPFTQYLENVYSMFLDFLRIYEADI